MFSNSKYEGLENMETKLKNIAQLYTGFTQRPGESSSAGLRLKTIQIGGLAKGQMSFGQNDLSDIEWAYDSRPQFLKHNSVIVTARGDVRASIFKGDVTDQVVVSNQFIVVEIMTDLITPEYLAWYITHFQQAQQHFAIHSQGTVLSMLSVVTLRELLVVIPPISQQLEILKRRDEIKVEEDSFQRLIRLRQEYNEALNEHTLLQAKKLASSTDLIIGDQ